MICLGLGLDKMNVERSGAADGEAERSGSCGRYALLGLVWRADEVLLDGLGLEVADGRMGECDTIRYENTKHSFWRARALVGEQNTEFV